MVIGLNRRNDTPIGGIPEFRGNMQGGDIWSVDSVPAWDGTKFAPAANSGLLMAFGGLATNGLLAVPADGSLIQNWDEVTPLGGTPLQTIVDDVAGTIAVEQVGVYQIDFNANVAGLVNNQEYSFLLNVDGVDRAYGAIISGTNSLEVGSLGFSLMLEASNTGVLLGVSVTNGGGNDYEIVTASFAVRRIG